MEIKPSLEAVQELIAIVKKKYGSDISMLDAEFLASSLLELYSFAIEGLPSRKP